jgi:hypothetical protein
MTTAFCLGNGLSRKQVNPNLLANYGKVYGCNALYREFTPTALIATDKPIASEIQESGYSAKNRFYTRKPIPNMGAHQVPKKYYGNSSGPICAAIACIDQNTKIYLLGYDMGPTLQGRFNNIYADTQHYKKSTQEPTYTGNWVRQLRQVFVDFPAIEFIRVVGETTAKIPDFTDVANLKHLPMDDFINAINTGKDL